MEAKDKVIEAQNALVEAKEKVENLSLEDIKIEDPRAKALEMK